MPIGTGIVNTYRAIKGRAHYELDVIEVPARPAVTVDLRTPEGIEQIADLIVELSAMAEAFGELVDSARAQTAAKSSSD